MRPALKKSLVLGCLCLCIAAVFSACGQEKKAAPKPDQATAAAQGDAGGGDSADGGDSPAAIKDPLKNVPSEEVEIPMADHLKLVGQLLDPSQVSEGKSDATPPATETKSPPPEGAAGKKFPLVILLHSLDGSHRDWQAFPAKLLKAGYAVFSVDLRGHGKSTQKGDEAEHMSWREFSTEDWKQLPQDVEQILKFFKASEDYPQVDSSRVALIGASLGANVAILEGVHNKKAVQALILLSPGLDYKGLETSGAMIDYPNAVFIAASQKDPYVYESADKLYHWALGAKAIRIYRNVGAGADMLQNQPSLGEEILKWLIEKFPPVAQKATAPATSEAPDAKEETAKN